LQWEAIIQQHDMAASTRCSFCHTRRIPQLLSERFLSSLRCKLVTWLETPRKTWTVPIATYQQKIILLSELRRVQNVLWYLNFLHPSVANVNRTEPFKIQSQSYITTDSQSASPSWCHGLDNQRPQEILGFLKFFLCVIPFYLQSVPVHSANCVKDVYSGM
jgi:hypothetical protein